MTTITIKSLRVYRGVTKQRTTEARRQTDWTKFSNEDLKFAYDLLALHNSPFEVDAMNEIARRVTVDVWLDLESPPPLIHNVPKLFYIFPFSLLWRQNRR